MMKRARVNIKSATVWKRGYAGSRFLSTYSYGKQLPDSLARV